MANKLEFFDHMHDSGRCVPWTDEKEAAEEWRREGHVVVARKVLTGHSGNGIIICGDEDETELPQAPLYTKYIKKDSEYRLHFVGGECIDVQRKIRDPEKEPTDWKVRSHVNGFIFARDGVVVPDDVNDQAKLIFDASGLDFGAVDVIYNRKQASAYCLEINTGPGLEGQTIQKYAEAFRKHYS
jgi:glutathione synthase/RimK-type ligase-like ATP-grasp enzyme